ncbi:MAG TPA: hypothetical protein VGR15_02785, partial [Bacteroidota bacterium]|nr:hypothetical protein [Bacteroidota bacterium]
MKQFSLVVVLLILVSLSGIAAINGGGETMRGVSSTHSVMPSVARPSLHPTGPSVASGRFFDVPLRYDVPKEHIDNLKKAEHNAVRLGGREIQFDANVGGGALAPSQGTNFNGMAQNGWIPYDGAMAAGPTHIVDMTNAQWAVYTRAGVNVSTTQFATWWGTSSGTPFDPKCVYDNASGHFVILATSVGNGLAKMFVSVSQTSNPTGAWWNYAFDWRLDGTTLTGNWGDYPGLGYDDNAIYINANQYTISGNSYQYSKVRVLSKAQLYSGAAASYTDFVNLRNADGTSAFTVKPARCLSASASEYLLNTRAGGGSSVTLWRIDNAPASPTLTRVATVSIGNYTVPPDAKQPGTGQLVATGDCRTQDVVWRNGFVYNGFSEKQGTNRKSQRSALRYLKIGSTGIVNKDITYTATGIEMYYPAVTSDGSENMYLSFSRSSKTEYASMYRTGMLLTDGAIQASNLVKAGISTNTSGRWGDYNAIANDPVDAGDVWMYAGWANSSNRWATWNAATSFGTPPVAQRYDVAETPASTPGAAFALKGNFPNPFNPVTTIHY